MTKIDNIDKNIVRILQDDSTLTNNEIAEQLAMSEATVRRRRHRLRKLDVIREVAVADPFKLGFNVMVIIGVKIRSNMLEEITGKLKAMREVRFLGLTIGAYDLMLEAWFRSNDELLDFVTIKLAAIDGIQRTESFQVMRLVKYTYDWGQPSAVQALLDDEVAE